MNSAIKKRENLRKQAQILAKWVFRKPIKPTLDQDKKFVYTAEFDFNDTSFLEKSLEQLNPKTKNHK